MPEQQITVVFDVSAEDREVAANTVAYAIGMNNPKTPVGYSDSGGTIESWWFPEDDIKHVDGNDNGAFALVPLDFIELVRDAIEDGDGEGLDLYLHVLSTIIADRR